MEIYKQCPIVVHFFFLSRPLTLLPPVIMDVEESRSNEAPTVNGEGEKQERMFSLKKWNAVAMWSWDVECDTCAICRVQVMDACLRQESL